jgi:hypothetical protein
MPVYKVQGPDNKVYKFEGPEGASPDDVVAFAEQHFNQEPKGVISQAYDKRAGMAREAADAYQRGEQSLPETFAQITGKGVAGFANDMVGEGLSAITPEPIKEVGRNVVNYLADTPVGDLAKSVSTKYGEFSQKHPRAARNIEAAGNIGGYVAALTPVKGQSAIARAEQAATPAIAKTGQLVKSAKDVISPRKITADDLKAISSAQYKRADSLGGQLRPAIADQFVNDLQSIRPQTEAGKVMLGNDELSELVERAQELRGKPISLQAAQEIDEGLGQLIDKYTVLGKTDKEGIKIIEAQSRFRDLIENAPENMIEGGKEGFESLKAGRKNWAAQSRLRDIERVIDKASKTDTPAKSIATAFKNFADNPSKMRGFSPQEKIAIRQASKTGIVTDLLRLAGSKLIPIGAGVATGGMDGLAAASAAYAVGGAARAGANALQMRKANKISDLIVERSGVNRKNISSLLGDN